MAKDLLRNKINLRAIPTTGSVLGLIEGAYSELEALQQECQEIVDNASEGLSQSQRIQTLEETASALDFAYNIPEVPEAVQDLVVNYTEDRRKSKSTSRATRCAEAVSLLQTVTELLNEFANSDQRQELIEEVEQLISELDEAIGYAEGCEFPGMYC